MSRARFQPAPRSPVPAERPRAPPTARVSLGPARCPLSSADLHVLHAASKRFFKGEITWNGRGRVAGAPRPQTPPPTSRVPRPSGAGPGRLIHELRAECPPHPVSDCGGQTHTHRIQNDGGAELRGQAGQAGRRKRLRNGVGADGRPRHCPRRKPGSGTGRSGSGRAGLGVQADEGGG